eukprot:TRINITY_DN3720_c0_g1_i1.p1 TRINITY_DN3720_c0_g1~~TRINITY_DN3720_c0_g1_i1.p1  ORF type:complete len:353 (+),score=50.27 TRINITY_DN3720_c0_g1_i1:222-1280(+)
MTFANFIVLSSPSGKTKTIRSVCKKLGDLIGPLRFFSIRNVNNALGEFVFPVKIKPTQPHLILRLQGKDPKISQFRASRNLSLRLEKIEELGSAPKDVEHEITQLLVKFNNMTSSPPDPNFSRNLFFSQIEDAFIAFEEIDGTVILGYQLILSYDSKNPNTVLRLDYGDGNKKWKLEIFKEKTGLKKPMTEVQQIKNRVEPVNTDPKDIEIPTKLNALERIIANTPEVDFEKYPDGPFPGYPLDIFLPIPPVEDYKFYFGLETLRSLPPKGSSPSQVFNGPVDSEQELSETEHEDEDFKRLDKQELCWLHVLARYVPGEVGEYTSDEEGFTDSEGESEDESEEESLAKRQRC